MPASRAFSMRPLERGESNHSGNAGGIVFRVPVVLSVVGRFRRRAFAVQVEQAFRRSDGGASGVKVDVQHEFRHGREENFVAALAFRGADDPHFLSGGEVHILQFAHHGAVGKAHGKTDEVAQVRFVVLRFRQEGGVDEQFLPAQLFGGGTVVAAFYA